MELIPLQHISIDNILVFVASERYPVMAQTDDHVILRHPLDGLNVRLPLSEQDRLFKIK